MVLSLLAEISVVGDEAPVGVPFQGTNLAQQGDKD